MPQAWRRAFSCYLLPSMSLTLRPARFVVAVLGMAAKRWLIAKSQPGLGSRIG